MKAACLLAVLVALFTNSMLCIVEDACQDLINDPVFLETEFSVSPAQAVYQVGDTLVIRSVGRGVLRNRASQESVNLLPGTSLSTYSYLDRIDTLYQESSEHNRMGIAATPFIDSTGIDPSLFRLNSVNWLVWEHAQFERTALSYSLVLEEPGDYVLGHSGYFYFEPESRPDLGNCPNQPVGAYFDFPEGRMANLDLLLESPWSRYNRPLRLALEEEYGQQGSFAFRVIE